MPCLGVGLRTTRALALSPLQQGPIRALTYIRRKQLRPNDASPACHKSLYHLVDIITL